MSKLSSKFRNTRNQILHEEDIEGMQSIAMLQTRLADGFWERYHETKMGLKEDGEWPEVEFNDETREITVTRGNEVTCTAKVGVAPGRHQPDAHETIHFGDKCDKIDKDAIRLKNTQ